MADIRPILKEAAEATDLIVDWSEPVTLPQLMDAYHTAFTNAALSACNGNVSHASKLLGIKRTTLYSRMAAARKKSTAAREPEQMEEMREESAG